MQPDCQLLPNYVKADLKLPSWTAHSELLTHSRFFERHKLPSSHVEDVCGNKTMAGKRWETQGRDVMAGKCLSTAAATTCKMFLPACLSGTMQYTSLHAHSGLGEGGGRGEIGG